MELSTTSVWCLTFLLTFDLGRSVSLPENLDNHPTVRAFREYLDAKVVEFEKQLMQTFREHRRYRRNAVTDTHILLSDGGVQHYLTWEPESMQPVQFNGTTVINHFYVDGDNYLIVGKPRADDGSYQSEAVIMVYNSDDGVFEDTGLTIPTYGLSDIGSRLIGNYVYIAIANQQIVEDSYDTLSYIYIFDYTDMTVQIFQQFQTHGASDMEFFSYEGVTYLAVANMRQDSYAQFETELGIYEYNSQYFDFVTSTATSYAKNVAAFVIDNILYLAVAQFSDNDGNDDICVNLYHFDTDAGELEFHQCLPSNNAVDVEAFSFYDQHFVAVANYMYVDSDGVENYETESVIYWWQGDQFWEYQTISTNGATHWEYIEMTDDIHVLAVTNSKDSEQPIVFYQYDDDSGDWLECYDPQIIEYEERIKPGTVSMTTVSIEMDIFLLLSNSEMDYSNSSSVDNTNVFKVLFSNATLEMAGALVHPAHTTDECIFDIDAEIHDMMSNMTALMNTIDGSASLTKPNNITGPVTFTGNITFLGAVHINDSITIVEDYEYELDPDLVAAAQNNQQQIKNMTQAVDNFAVTLDTEQVVNGVKTFQETIFVTDYTEATESNITIDGNRINGMDLENLYSTVVRYVGDYVIDGTTTFKEPVRVGDIVVTGAVNGLMIPDAIMTVEGSQTSAGYLTFNTTVTFRSDVEVKGQVNGVDLYLDVVTTFENNTISGRKLIIGDITAWNGIKMKNGTAVDTVDLSEFAWQVVLLSEGGIISGGLTFNGGVVFSNINITNNLINRIHFDKFVEDLVWVDEDQVIFANKNVTESIHVNGSIHITGTVNDFDVSRELITLSTDQTIMTDIRIVNDVKVLGDITVDDKVNGIDLSAEAVLIQGDQTVTGMVNFTRNVTVKEDIDMEVGATVSGVDINELNRTSVKINGPEVIAGVKCFTENVEVIGDVITATLISISDVDVSVLASDYLSKSQPQTLDILTQVKGHVTLQNNVTMLSTFDSHLLSEFILLDSDGSINGVKRFLDETILERHLNLTSGQFVHGRNLPRIDIEALRIVGDQTIQGPLRFISDLFVKGHINVTGLVNGLDLSEDVVTLDQTQNIAGDKIFSNAIVHVEKEVFVSDISITLEMVNEVNVVWLMRNAVIDQVDANISGSKIFQEIQVLDDLIVNGTINEVAVTIFADTAVFLDEDTSIKGAITFLSDVHFMDNVTIKTTLNGVDIETSSPLIVLKDTDGDVLGNKTFDSDVNVEGDVHIGDLVNGIDLPELNMVYLSKTIPQSIPVSTTFLQDIYIENMDLTGTTDYLLDGVDTSLMALVNADETFTVDMQFDVDLEVEGDAIIDGLVDGVDIVEFNSTAVRISGQAQKVDGTKIFKSAEIDGNITMVALAMVNDIDVSELDDRVVWKEGNQTIRLPTVYEVPVHIFGNLEGFNISEPVDLRFLIKDAFTFSSYEPITGSKIFTAPLNTTHLDIDGDLQIDVTKGTTSLWYLLNNTVTMTTDQNIEGRVRFADNVTFLANIVVSGTVDTVDLSEAAVLVITDQTLTGRATFTQGFEIQGDLTVNGVIDSIDLVVCAAEVVLLSEEQVLSGTWEFTGDFAVNGDVTITGRVNNIIVRRQLVTLTRNQTLRGVKTFLGNITVVDDLLSCDTLNSEDLPAFRDDMVRKDGGHYEISACKGITLYSKSERKIQKLTKHKNHKKHTHTKVQKNNRRKNVKALDDDEALEDEACKIFTDPFTLTHNMTVGLVNGVNITQIQWDFRDVALYQDEQMASLNQTMQQQCSAINYLERTAEVPPMLLSHWKDHQIFNKTAISFIDTIPYEGITLLVTSDGCSNTHLYICPSLDPCWLVNDELPSASSAKMYAFEMDTFLVLTGSSVECGEAEIDSSGNMTRVLMIENEEFDVWIESATPVDSTMFEIDEGGLFLVIVNHEDPKTGNKVVYSTLHKYSSEIMDFTLHQEIETHGARAVSFMQYRDFHWLALANGFDDVDSVILLWNHTEEVFQPSSAIPTEFTTCSDMITFLVDGLPYMVFSSDHTMDNGHFDVLDFDQPVLVYTYFNVREQDTEETENSGWEWKQDIMALGVTDLDFFAINDEAFLVMVSRFDIIYVYRLSGIGRNSTFMLHDTLPIEGAVHAHPFIHHGGLYMAVARHGMYGEVIDSQEPMIMQGVTRGPPHHLAVLDTYICQLMLRLDPVSGNIRWSLYSNERCHCDIVIAHRRQRRSTYRPEKGELWYTDDKDEISQMRNWTPERLDQLLDRAVDCATCYENCLNGGSCTGPDTCTCIEGYTNTHCQTLDTAAEVFGLHSTAICDPSCEPGTMCVAPKSCMLINAEALGMEARSITTNQISASEDVHGWPTFRPHDMRLNANSYYFFLTSLSGTSTSPWIQIDFDASKLITAVIVQGGCIFEPCSTSYSGSYSGWVTTFHIQTSNTSTSDLEYVVDNENHIMTFEVDAVSYSDEVMVPFPRPVTARILRILPLTFQIRNRVTDGLLFKALPQPRLGRFMNSYTGAWVIDNGKIAPGMRLEVLGFV